MALPARLLSLHAIPQPLSLSPDIPSTGKGMTWATAAVLKQREGQGHVQRETLCSPLGASNQCPKSQSSSRQIGRGFECCAQVFHFRDALLGFNQSEKFSRASGGDSLVQGVGGWVRKAAGPQKRPSQRSQWQVWVHRGLSVFLPCPCSGSLSSGSLALP